MAPEGYSIATDTYFQLKADGTVDTANTTTNRREDGVLLVEDAMTSVKISKADVTSGEEVAGATIQILDAEGNVVTVNGESLEWVSTKEAHEIKGLETGKKYILRETVAPEGYSIATDTYFQLKADGTVDTANTTTAIREDGVLLVEDTMTSVKISKADITSGEELAGATIQILDEDGKIVKINGSDLEWVSTDEAHEIKGLEAGKKYILRETVAPEGYSVTTDTYFQLKADGTVDKANTTTAIREDGVLLVEDTMTSVKISKADITSGEELAGATIQILDEDGKIVKINGSDLEWVSTDEAHEIKGLTIGKKYILRETVAPEGYSIATDTYFQLKKDGTVDTENTTTKRREDGVLLVEDTMTSVKISKADITSGEELAGATIQILDEDGKIVKINGSDLEWVSTDEAHEIKGLTTGKKYILRETVAPDGYSIATDTYFQLKADGTVDTANTTTKRREDGVLLVEDSMTSVKISKVDVTSKEEIAGAVIQILDAEEKVVAVNGENLEWVSTTEAHEIKGLTTGKKYILRETVAPEGYKLTTDTYFTLKADGTVDTANTTTKTDTDGVLLVEDAMTSVKISKVDITSGEELAGATIQILDEYGNDVSVNGTKIEWVSTTEAHEIKGLTTGKKYILRETVAPEGYCIATDTYFELNEDGTVNATKTTTKINDTSDNSLLVEDSLTRIYISKKDVEGINSLEGGVLQILNEDMTIAKDKDGNEIEVVTTDGEYTEITGLVAGKKYYIHEKTAPKGYKLTADLVFTLKEDGTVDFKGATKEVDGHTVMIMKDAVTSLNFTKVGKVNEKCADDSKKTEPLEGVTFKATLLDTEGKPLTNDDAFTATAVSNETGSVIFNNIPAGDYMIEEVSTLDHYELDDTVYYAKVSDAEDSVFEGLTRDFEATDAVVNNTLVNDQYRTDIVLQKVAENDPSKSLPGSLYELTKEVVTADGSKATVVVARARTGFNGKLKFAGVLADVEYTITEVEEPDGYYLSERPIHISFRLVSDPQDSSNSKVVFDATSFDGGEGTATVDENGNITWLEPVTVVKFAKYDEAGHFLPGATLQVVDKKGNVIVEPWISGTDYKEVSGIFISDASVEYRLVELAAPKGYEKAADVVFHLDDEKVGPNAGREIIVSMTDKLSPVVKEADVSDGKSEGKNDSVTNIQTGDNAPIIPVAGLMILSLVGFVVIFSKKKKNKKEA